MPAGLQHARAGWLTGDPSNPPGMATEQLTQASGGCTWISPHCRKLDTEGNAEMLSSACKWDGAGRGWRRGQHWQLPL